MNQYFVEECPQIEKVGRILEEGVASVFVINGESIASLSHEVFTQMAISGEIDQMLDEGTLVEHLDENELSGSIGGNLGLIYSGIKPCIKRGDTSFYVEEYPTELEELSKELPNSGMIFPE